MRFNNGIKRVWDDSWELPTCTGGGLLALVVSHTVVSVFSTSHTSLMLFSLLIAIKPID